MKSTYDEFRKSKIEGSTENQQQFGQFDEDERKPNIKLEYNEIYDHELNSEFVIFNPNGISDDESPPNEVGSDANDSDGDARTTSSRNGLESLHTINDFECFLCNCANPSKYQLFSHMRKHIGEKRYKCKICSKKFANSGVI